MCFYFILEGWRWLALVSVARRSSRITFLKLIASASHWGVVPLRLTLHKLMHAPLRPVRYCISPFLLSQIIPD